ncbi:MAG: tetratricopeptide repeat protein [Kordia sp.]|uniref:tetratricopeptide repeat protein n=1 Tax=Kordia sp. TaxID=1965332 RepID=UPI0038594029
MKYIFSCLLSFCSLLSFSQETTEVFAKNEDVNDEKVIAFGQRFSDSFYEEDSTFFMDNFNLDSFAKKVMSINEEVSENIAVKKFNSIFKDGVFFDKLHLFPQSIRKAIKEDASYGIVNYYYHLDERKYHLLFRMYSENIGVNYHDYQLSFENEEFQLQDVFVYTTGQYLSETYQDFYQLSIPSKDTKITRQRLRSLVFIRMYKNLIKMKRYDKAFNLIQNLKGEFTEKRIYHIIKIDIASKFNRVFHMQAIDELLKKFPNDPTTKLMAIDYYVMLKDYNATMQLLDELKETTEDDFIEYIRANAAWQFEDYELAEKAYAEIIKEYPNFENAKLNLLYLYDQLEKHEDNIVLLNRMIESEEYLKKDLIEYIDDTSNEFINLPNARIYKRWKRKK